MQHELPQHFKRVDVWREGKWLDLWSVVHFLSGGSLAFMVYLFNFGAPASCVLAFVLLVAYEMWEALVQIDEAPTNRCMDVVVGMSSFAPTFLLVLPRLLPLSFIAMFVVLLGANILMSVLGWRASQKAAVLEKRMRARYAFERARFLARRAHRKQRKLKH